MSNPKSAAAAASDPSRWQGGYTNVNGKVDGKISSYNELARSGDKYFKILSYEDPEESSFNGYYYNPLGFQWHN